MCSCEGLLRKGDLIFVAILSVVFFHLNYANVLLIDTDWAVKVFTFVSDQSSFETNL